MQEFNEREVLPAPKRTVKAKKDPERSRLSKRSCRKGKQGERDAVALLIKHGMLVVRGFGDKISGDVRYNGQKIEVKRGYKWKTIYKLIAPAWALMFRQDNEEWLVCIRAKDFAELVNTRRTR